MKKFVALLFCMVSVCALAQPVQRNPFTTNSPVATNGFVKNLRSYQGDAALITPGQDVRNHGAVQNTYLNFMGGSAASLSDMPSRGNEIWSNVKNPIMVLSSRGDTTGSNNLQSCNESVMLQTIYAMKTNGVLGFMTNNGVNVIYNAENGWLTNHRDGSGNLQWMTGRWPSAASDPANIATMLRTNNVGLGLQMYANPLVPTNSNTEIDLNPVTGSDNFWHYPNGSNPLGAVEIQPLIDGLHVHQDISKFYAWGVDMFTMQDVGQYYYLAGYQNSIFNQIAYAIQFPIFNAFFQDRTYSGWYTTRRTKNGMIFNSLISDPTPGTTWPMASEYQLNGICFGSGGQSTEPAGSGVMGETISNVRPQIYTITNWLDRTSCLIMQGDNLSGMDSWSHTDWKAHLSVVGMFQAYLWLTYPQYLYAVKPAFYNQVTNAGFYSIWQDQARHRPTVVNFGVSNAIFARKLEHPNKMAVLFCNLAPTSTNLTVTWSNLCVTPGIPAYVTEVWTNTYLGLRTNSLTVTVEPTNSYWVTLEFAAMDHMVSAGLIMSNNFRIYPGANPNETFISTPTENDAVKLYTSGEIGIGSSALIGTRLTLYNISGQNHALDFGGGSYQLGRNGTDAMFYINGAQAANNGVVISGVDGEGARFLPTATSVSTVSNLAVNNLTLKKTNAAPTSVTVGTTAPDAWVLITNNALRYYIPVWTNH